MAPTVHLLDLAVDGKTMEFSQATRLRAGSQRVQIRYAAIYLTAPERVQYSHKLEGLDADWVAAGHRREINYNSLRHGNYRFLVRASSRAAPRRKRHTLLKCCPNITKPHGFVRWPVSRCWRALGASIGSGSGSSGTGLR